MSGSPTKPSANANIYSSNGCKPQAMNEHITGGCLAARQRPQKRHVAGPAVNSRFTNVHKVRQPEARVQGRTQAPELVLQPRISFCSFWQTARHAHAYSTVRKGFSSPGIAWASQASPEGRLTVAQEGA